MADLTAIEEQLAHLTRMLDDLSDVVARQEREIATLTRRVALLLQEEAARQAGLTDGPAPAADQPPPHW